MTITVSDTKSRFIEIRYQTDDCIHDLLKSLQEILTINLLPENLLIKTYAYNCNFNITYEDTEAIIKLMQLLSEKCSYIKHAVLTDNPKHTAMMSLAAEKLKNNPNYYLKLFCTNEAANIFLLAS